MEKIQITRGYLPGAIGKIVELHGTYYSSNWSSGLFFEAKVAREMAGFLERYDDNRDGFWIASADGRIERSIAVDGIKAAGEGAHLRWFIVSGRLRQEGVGNRLFSTAVEFCRRKHTAWHISGHSKGSTRPGTSTISTVSTLLSRHGGGSGEGRLRNSVLNAYLVGGRNDLSLLKFHPAVPSNAATDEHIRELGVCKCNLIVIPAFLHRSAGRRTTGTAASRPTPSQKHMAASAQED